MRRIAIFCLLALAGTLAADEKPSQKLPTDPVQGADAVLAATAASDKQALRALADLHDPDPWLVADELSRREAHAAAEALAQAARRYDTVGLADYLASRRGKPPKEIERRALAQMNAAIEKKAWSDALAAVAGVDAGRLDSVVRVRAAFGRGIAQRELGQLRESAATLTTCGRGALELGWLRRANAALLQAGMIARRAGNLAGALEAWKLRLRVELKRQTLVGIAGAFYNLALVHLALGEFESALGHLRECLEIRRRSRDDPGIAAALQLSGDVLEGMGDLPAALKHFDEALEVFRRLDDKSGIARALRSGAVVRDYQGLHQEALVRLQESLRLRREFRDPMLIANALQSIGLVQQNLGNHTRALEHFREAARVRQGMGDQAGVAKALLSMGLVHEDLGEQDKALLIYRRTISMRETLRDGPGLCDALNTLGNLQLQLTKHGAALSSFERGLAIAEALADKQRIADMLHSVGLAQRRLGAYAASLANYGRSLEMKEALGDEAGACSTMNNIGVIRSNLGDFEGALAILERTLARREKLDDQSDVCETLANIANVHAVRGEIDEALSIFLRTLAILEALADKESVFDTLLNIGDAYGRLGRYTEALATLRRALAMRGDLGGTRGVCTTLSLIASVLETLGREEEALAAYREAARLREEMPSLEGQAHVSLGYAALHLRQGKLDEAVRLARDGVACVADLYEGLAGDEGASARDTFAELFDVGHLAALRAKRHEDLAWFLEQGRAGSFREALGSRAALEAAVIPAGLLRELNAARQIERRAHAALLAARDQPVLAVSRRAKATWKEARDAVDRMGARLEREANSAARTTLAEPDALSEIQTYLQPFEALVLFGLTEHQEGMALIVQAKAVRSVTLPASKDIDQAAEEVIDYDGAFLRTDKVVALRKLVTRPLALGKDVKRVLISPVGRLGYVPFSLLLLDKEIVYVPSGTTLGLLRAEHAKRGAKVLGVGDPDYTTVVRESSRPLQRGRELRRLPASRVEVEAIADVALLGKDATETAFPSAAKKEMRWRAVHLACHGLLDPEHPMLSSLALTPDEANDGFLTALEVFRMRIPADLVVLSACESGKGRIYKTEGIVGLARAFMFAGAPRVIASLWNVDDEATQALMVKFYELWNPKEGEGKGAAEALKAAQAFVREHTQWSHPRFWAAWVLWGLPE